MDLTTLIIVLLIVVALSEAIKTIKNNRPVGRQDSYSIIF